MADDKELLNAAISDPAFNEYDHAAIKKELMLTRAYIARELGYTFMAQFLSFVAAVAIIFMPLSELTKGYLTIIASPSAAVALFKTGKLEQIISQTKKKR